MPELDTQARLRAFAFLDQQTSLYPDGVPYTVLLKGFEFEGHRVPLINPQGMHPEFDQSKRALKGA